MSIFSLAESIAKRPRRPRPIAPAIFAARARIGMVGGRWIVSAGRQAAVLALALSIVAFAPCRAAEDETVVRSPILDLILEYVTSNPEASLAEVAAFANARLEEHGLVYEFYRYDYLPDGMQLLDAGERRFLVEMGNPDYSGPCGEYWTFLSAIHADDERIDIIHKGEKIAVKRPDGLRLNRVIVYSADQQSIVAKFHMPRQIWPSDISPDGRTIFVSYPLYDKGLAWWARMKKRYPQIYYEYPFLHLAIGPNGIRFDDDPKHVIDAPTEEIKDFPGMSAYLRRWRFLESGLVAEIEMPCT